MAGSTTLPTGHKLFSFFRSPLWRNGVSHESKRRDSSSRRFAFSPCEAHFRLDAGLVRLSLWRHLVDHAGQMLRDQPGDLVRLHAELRGDLVELVLP